MNADTLSAAMGRVLPFVRYQALLPGANECLRLCNCNTIPRAAMLLAQVGHESVGLKYTEEIASGSAYEGRPDLGNVRPGDGVRYKGRGFIQCTGRHNYTQFSAWAHARKLVPSPTYFTDNPTQLSNDRYAWHTVVWYWNTRNLNRYSDNRDIVGATRVIQGASGGLEDRRTRWNRCLALGNAILPDKAGADQLNDKDRDEVKRMIANALRAYHLGGTYGIWSPEEFPQIIKGPNWGVGDRLTRLENKK